MTDRRNFIKLATLGGGVVFVSGLAGCAQMLSDKSASLSANNDFYFVQLSDPHWGYSGPDNPDAANTLKKAVATVNNLEIQPDFIMFTGDLTHTTDDPVERRKRLAQFRTIVGALKVKNVHFMPGEHDAALDHGAAFKEFFGEPNYAFDYKGIHFLVVDNVSEPGSSIGEKQLAWMQADLAKQAKDTPIIVFTRMALT